MLSKLIQPLRVLIVIAAAIAVLGVNASFSPLAHAATIYNGPTLRLPWVSGSYTVAGYSYNCGDHTGKDQFALDFGLRYAPVSAVFAGTVHIGAYDLSGYGNNLWVTNGSYRAIYAHLGDNTGTNTGILVKEGQPVVQGQTLGVSGSSGRSTAAHLHFSLRLGGTGRYDGTAVVPEPMSGYTGFGNLTTCVNNPNSYTPGALPSSSATINFSFSVQDLSTSPKHTSRTATVNIFNASGNVVETDSQTVTYNSGVFSGAFFTKGLAAGAYTVNVKLSNTLSKAYGGFFTAPTATVNESGVVLKLGDINNDNSIDILDYNDLLSCWGSKFPTCAFNPNADLNDDGVVDGVDYNIYLRSVGSQGS